MLEPTQPNPLASAPPPPLVMAAKFPPDDADLPPDPPAGSPAGMGGPPGYSGPEFQPKRFPTGVVLVGLAIVALVIGGIFVAMKAEEKQVTVPEAEEIKKEVFILPEAEQVPKWRHWAASKQSSYLQQEALKQLAWAKDPEGVDLAIAALSSLEEGVVGQAATALAEYGLPMAEKAKPALLKALQEGNPAYKPQVAWALVELKEPAAFEQVMTLYREGHLSKVQRLNGAVAFDPQKIVKLVSLDQLASLAGDPSGAVRQLVATVLSRHAEEKYTDVLIKLLEDSDKEISRQAAPGLGKIGSDKAREPLLKMLRGADKESREKYLLALRDGVGTKGLLMALDTVATDDADRAWFQTKTIFDLIEGSKESGTFGLNDPRGADALVEYIEKKPHVHWQTRAATALAQVGDVRAVPTLARRLRMDPLKIYSDDTDYEMLLKRDDFERVVASRMIADLVKLHPDKKDQIREQAEDALIFWIHELPSPHANGLRALAAMGSTKDIEAFRSWANPDAPLPKEGQQPPMPEEWVIAQSAMRYVGVLQDKESWKVLEDALKMRPKEVDVTMESLLQGGLAILGMTLRAVGVGAAHGFAEWGDQKAFKPLLEYIEEPRENEQSREAACAALAWVATPDDMIKVAEKIQEYKEQSKSHQFIRACLLETLVQRPIPGTAPALLGLMNEVTELKTRTQVARAIGKAGLTPDVEAKLFEMMENEVLMNDAALALILGGQPSTAARAVAFFAKKEKKDRKPALDALQDLYFHTFGYWSDEDLAKGSLFRWVDNALAITRVQIDETPQEWARILLERQFNNLTIDNGPRSFTRVVLRYRLMDMAKGKDAAQRDGALRTLKFMGEQGVLLALRDEPGEIGELAGQAYHELMNPKIVTQGVIDTKDEEKK